MLVREVRQRAPDRPAEASRPLHGRADHHLRCGWSCARGRVRGGLTPARPARRERHHAAHPRPGRSRTGDDASGRQSPSWRRVTAHYMSAADAIEDLSPGTTSASRAGTRRRRPISPKLDRELRIVIALWHALKDLLNVLAIAIGGPGDTTGQDVVFFTNAILCLKAKG